MSVLSNEAQYFEEQKARNNIQAAAAHEEPGVPVTVFVVAAYDVSRHYGGPEEGGWYYSNGPLLGVLDVALSNDEATEKCWDINQAFNELDGSGEDRRVATVVELPRRELGPHIRPCHDVDYDESDYVTRWDIPAEYSEERPHYC